MRIGFFNGYKIWGGGEKWHYEMALYCQNNGDDVRLFGPKDGELAKRLSEKNIPLVDVEIGKSSYFNPLFLSELRKKIKEQDLDVLVFNSFRDVRAAALMARKAGVKKVILRCGMPIAPKESLSYFLNFNKGLHYFVPISKAVQEEFDLKAPKLLKQEQKVEFIPNGIDLDDFSYVGAQTSREELILGNASRLSDQKGLDYLLKVAKILKDRGLKFKVKIAGSGEEEKKLRILQFKLGLEDHVEFVGHTDDVASFVKDLDIYIFTSKYEGTARSLIEAFACGKPAVAFNISSMKEIIDHEKNGLLARAFDEIDFANQVQRLIENPDERLKFAEQGRKKAEELFDRKKNFARWYKFLKDV